MSNQQELLQYQRAIDQLTGQRDREAAQLDQLEAAVTDANQNVRLARQAGLPAAQIQALELVEKQAFQAAAAKNQQVEQLQTDIINQELQKQEALEAINRGAQPQGSTVDDPLANEEERNAELQRELDEQNTKPFPDPVAEEEARNAELQRELDEQNANAVGAPAPVDVSAGAGDYSVVPFESETFNSEGEVISTETRYYVRDDKTGQNLTSWATPEEAQAEIERQRALDAEFEELNAGQDALEAAAREEAERLENLKNQATRQSRYKKPGSSDWRVRLQLGERNLNLYNASKPGILKPLAATNGVVFPYTPQINTSYKANYEQYDLVHSNYRGLYYKNSRVDDLNIRATFTAQDTREAEYVLAVIHFFRSVTKMFYGQDTERGTPPPLVYLSGLGMDQFYGHPCVVSNFQYNLPDNVDYIRANNVNDYGTDLLNRRFQGDGGGFKLPGGGATVNRILNAGLDKFFPQTKKPVPDAVERQVNNKLLASYVPTKMEIDITLIPVQTRSQVSKQFSLADFANGDLLKKGFW
jgi:hypothetical protein